MIMLENLSGEEFCLNSNLIYKIEESPDTMITLTSGKVIRVRDKTEDIIEKIIDYNRRIHSNVMEGAK